jgi:hypothetical protein
MLEDEKVLPVACYGKHSKSDSNSASLRSACLVEALGHALASATFMGGAGCDSNKKQYR